MVAIEVERITEAGLGEMNRLLARVHPTGGRERMAPADWVGQRSVNARSQGKLVGILPFQAQGGRVLALSPGELLGGRPVVLPGETAGEIAAALVQAAGGWARANGYEAMEAVTSLEGDDWYQEQGFHLQAEYVGMVCRLGGVRIPAANLPEALRMAPLGSVTPEALYACYTAAFGAGDARFFFDQSEEERRDYFDTLGLEEAREEAASLALLCGRELVGFTYVLPYGEGNRHISCMCVLPEEQGQGLGRAMLGEVMRRAAAGGVRSLSLGTDTRMRAYELYRRNGFEVQEGSKVWRR